jgi:hypothetical protein
MELRGPAAMAGPRVNCIVETAAVGAMSFQDFVHDGMQWAQSRVGSRHFSVICHFANPVLSENHIRTYW